MKPLECGIVILPPADLADEMRRRQAAFPPAYVPLYPPHLTVKAQVRRIVAGRRVERAVARVCARSAPFALALDGLDCFCEQGAGDFYVAVQRSEPLQTLHESLLRALAPLTKLSDSVAPGHEGPAFHPHLTLLRHVPESEMEATRDALAGFRPAGTFLVESVSLICHVPDQPWRGARAFGLGRGAPPAGSAMMPVA